MEYGVSHLTDAHYERTSRLIWHFLNRVNLPPDVDRDDLAQDVWVKLVSAEFYPEMEGATSYVSEAVRSVVATATGESARHRHCHLSDNTPESGESDESATQLTSRQVLDILQHLKAKHRDLLEDRYISGLSVSKIAKKRRITPEQARVAIDGALRAARRLRGKLAD